MKLSAVIAKDAPKNDPVLLRGNILESAAKLKTFGYTGAEIHLRAASEIDRDALFSYCEKTGMSVSAFATGMAKRLDGLCFIDDDAGVRAKAVERVKGFLELAAPFRAGVIIGSMRGAIPDKENRKKWDERFLSCLKELLDFAEKRNATVFIEAINRYENNYLNNAAETLAYLEPLKSDRIKINLDTFHMNIEETDMSAAIRLCGKKLGHIHLADNTRRFVGSGTIDFSAVFRAAAATDYDGWYSLECLSDGDAERALGLSYTNWETAVKRN
jgi:sugar phosphate isomerase/epimerase